ncbi:MAG: single-stranded-DNA-specific exonuclease RecJ [Armatimonadota bacterium]|jgi:single-stranded-DNA-specific exonuclease
MTQAIWETAPRNAAAEDELTSELGISPVVASVLVSRGIATPPEARSFLWPTLDDAHDPLLLPQMAEAVARLDRALQAGETILVHGDYDADGVTATALLLRLLSKLRADVRYYIPNRITEDFGITPKTLRKAADDGVTLVLTVDCGTSSHEAAEEAARLGIDVLVTDHHDVDGALPECLAVVNPRREDSAYPNRDLSGVGVAFKLGEALVTRRGLPLDSYQRAYLDLVAVGTITDVCPLVGENRTFVKLGLERLEVTRKPGLRALMRLSRMNGRPSSRQVAFWLGPRLNAPGRLTHAAEALELLLLRDEPSARRAAHRLDSLNRERQREQERVFTEARTRVDRDCDLESERVVVLGSDKWPIGVVGPVASKLVELLHRPVVLISVQDSVARGSARSIAGFDIGGALGQCPDEVLRGGGHTLAAGVTLHATNIDALRARLNELAEESLAADDLQERLRIDRAVTLEEITIELAEELELLAPFGQDNPQPRLLAERLALHDCDCVGSGGQHLKLLVGDASSIYEAIGFGMAQKAREIARTGILDACFTATINEWGGTRSLQLQLHDVRVS